MTVCWPLAIVLVLCSASAVSTPRERSLQSSAATWGEAPDKERGFGAQRGVRDLERLLRSSDAMDVAVRTALRDLPAEVERLATEAFDAARARGQTKLLGQGDAQTLERLGEVFAEAASNVGARLEHAATSEALARALVDTRLRARLRAVRGLSLELVEMRAGFGLLAAQIDGHVSLDGATVGAIARRTDLAAARLRAIRLDLAALRPTEGADFDESAQRDLERWKVASASGGADRSARVADVVRELREREEQMCSALFTTRLAPVVARALRERRAAIDAASATVERVLELMPDTPQGRAAAPDVRQLPKVRRYAAAARAAQEGWNVDPLNATLCHLAAVSLDFQWGIRESRRWFDRFLALRGIRAHDRRTFKNKKLAAEERRALESVTLPEPAPR